MQAAATLAAMFCRIVKSSPGASVAAPVANSRSQSNPFSQPSSWAITIARSALASGFGAGRGATTGAAGAGDGSQQHPDSDSATTYTEQLRRGAEREQEGAGHSPEISRLRQIGQYAI